METGICPQCGNPYMEWGQFCTSCGEPRVTYAKPAGFWIRVGASLIDWVVFIPVMIIATWNMLAIKSLGVLILISIPGLVYKPVMHAFFGATVGKMACGIKVTDSEGNKLSVLVAYIRNIPFLLQAIVGLATQVFFYTSEEIHDFSTFGEYIQVMGEMQQQQQGRSPLELVSLLLGIFVIIECVVAAFTFRKRAVHDMIAGSFCVYKNP